MKISYANLSKKEITKEQIIPNAMYYKVFKDDNNKIVKQEFYNDEKLLHTYFYLDFGSSHQDILNLQTEESVVIIEIEQINDNYFKHYLFGYRNGILNEQDFSIYDKNGYCFMTHDIETNTRSRNETTKYYEDAKSGYEFEFSYYESGELSFVLVSNDLPHFYEPFRSDELDIIPNFEWWDQYSSYYLNAEPAIPEYIITIE